MITIRQVRQVAAIRTRVDFAPRDNVDFPATIKALDAPPELAYQFNILNI